ncbi:MAG: TatD family hydrolase [Promethearchaeota archaeon]
MSKKNVILEEPEKGLRFIDAHCHLPFPRKKNDKLPSDEQQYHDFFKMGGLYIVTSSIDLNTLKLTLNFFKKYNKNYGFTCGWAPQTVTYTPRDKYKIEWKEWINYVKSNPEKYIAIGEMGLDFHHAKTLDKRRKQIEEFRKIIENTKDLNKPYVLHVRNAAAHEFDRGNPKHEFNKRDGATQEILKILKEFKINPKKVMWHCFSGPEEYGNSLSKQGYTLSVPSSAYGFNRWRNVTKNASIESLVTETDSYYQHPFKKGPINVPSNVRYSIAAIAFTHDISQEIASKKTIENAINFYNLKIE